MGRFKQFLLSEQMGLGDLGTNIDKLMSSHWFGNAINGALVSTDWSGTEDPQTTGHGGQEKNLPGVDLTIPSIQRSGRITTLFTKKNPIYVRLSDGTEAHFSYDEYKRIQGTPALGKVMTITFQRHPGDFTNQYSKIDQAIVTD